jgi:hypothetical protein
MVLDERAVGSTLLQRITGLVDVPADREIPMLYTSFFGGRNAALLWSYGADAQAIAVGSTGGGVSVAGIDQIRPLSWDELSRDLRLARRLTDDVHVFSLEGCVRQSYLERLMRFDWDAPVDVPEAEAAKVNLVRFATRALLWVLARPVPMLVLLTLAYLIVRRRGGR